MPCLINHFDMHYDIIIIGGGAAGLMAAIGAGTTNPALSVLVLEKMPRPGRKIVITGKGRCNFTNLKDWGAFAPHVRANSNVLRASFQNLTPQGLIDFFKNEGMPAVVERGDRAFPESHRSMDVVDTLVNAANRRGARIRTGAEVAGIAVEEEYGERIFSVSLADGDTLTCSRLILATGGLSYPATGSTGDGYRFAESLGLELKPRFPSLTALVPRGYKNAGETTAQRVAAALSGVNSVSAGRPAFSRGPAAGRGHIDLLQTHSCYRRTFLPGHRLNRGWLQVCGKPRTGIETEIPVIDSIGTEGLQECGGDHGAEGCSCTFRRQFSFCRKTGLLQRSGCRKGPYRQVIIIVRDRETPLRNTA